MVISGMPVKGTFFVLASFCHFGNKGSKVLKGENRRNSCARVKSPLLSPKKRPLRMWSFGSSIEFAPNFSQFPIFALEAVTGPSRGAGWSTVVHLREHVTAVPFLVHVTGAARALFVI
jgi:hypothetical protein